MAHNDFIIGKVYFMANVSIVMPVYNAERYLRESISDILAQSYTDYELICVDDGSKDGSGKILDSFSNKDERIKVIHQANKGGGIARDNGLKQAKGKYVLFLDADDRFEVDLIKTIVGYAEINKTDILAFNADLFDSESKVKKSAPWLILKNEALVTENPFDVLNTTVWNKLFLRSFLQNNNLHFIDNKYSDTMFFVAMALLSSQKTMVCNQVLLHYRVNNKASLIANQDKDYMAVYRNLEYIKENLDNTRVKERTYFLRLAERVLTDRIRMMRTSESYSALYNMLHDCGIAKLGFDLNRFSETKEGTRLKGIYEKTLEEDLFIYKKNLLDSGMVNSEVFGIPDFERVNSDCCKIVLYGAGDVGRDYFRQIMNRKDLCMCAWVDKNYETIGFPIASPNTILGCQYDVVLIALNDEKNVDRIKADLEKIGVNRNKIIWKQPKFIAT